MAIDPRAPTYFIAIVGSVLDKPHASPSKEKVKPAAVIDQCNSSAIVNNTTPREANVAKFTKK